MRIVYAKQPFPESWGKAIFLAGPTPRADHPVPSWRPDALRRLRELGYDGVVFVPEPEDGNWGASDYLEQMEWETQGLNLADIIVFWVPRDLTTLPAFTTNVEFGHWVSSGKCVLGHPPDAPKSKYLDALWAQQGNPSPPHDTMNDTLGAAVDRLGEGAHRSGGERWVPLHVWQAPWFHEWYSGVRRAGNRLDEARVRWSFLIPGTTHVLAGVLWVNVWVEDESRHKSNEWIFGRTDISAVVLHATPSTRPQSLDDVLDTELLLIREFRSPCRNADGFVRELPSGSAPATRNSRAVAQQEVHEETGFHISEERLVAHGSRQVAATLSTHHVKVFSVALTAEEMASARAIAESGSVFGDEAASERTTVEIATFRSLIEAEQVDWSTLGLVTKALYALRSSG